MSLGPGDLVLCAGTLMRAGFQQDLLRKTLTDTGGNVAKTARRLDLARSHVHNLIRAFGLSRS